MKTSDTNSQLAAIQHTPKKSLGQNFLIDGNIVKKSLQWAGIVPGDVVVEIGPGLGVLTRPLLEAGAHVYAVELDENLHKNLSRTLAVEYGKTFFLLRGDAVKFPLAGLPQDHRHFKIVANLPYAIATPWLDGVLSGPLPSAMTLLLQKEAAERFLAPARTKKIGAISIRLCSVYDEIFTHPVSPRCFLPIPKVNSSLIHLCRKELPFIFSDRGCALIRHFFNHRRKQLRGVVKNLSNSADKICAEAWLQDLFADGIESSIRAEDLSLECWQKFEIYLNGNA